MPVAESRFRLNFAASRWIAFATGGAFSTRLWRNGTSQVGLKIPLSQVFTDGMPQMNTNTREDDPGHPAHDASPASARGARGPGGADGRAGYRRGRALVGEAPLSFGCQTFRNR